jgi:ABC-type Fe3+-hydroxamate transport system substrate-binding protein
MRIVSLVPSVTETLLAFGVTPVGVTRFCEHPELTAVGGTKDPDIAAIVALEPDLVVMCEEENRRDDAGALAAAGVPVCALVIDTVDDASFAVQALAGFAAVTHEPFEVPPAHAAGDGGEASVRAFVPIWRRPWMTMNASTYGSSVLAHLGIANVFADDDTRYPEVTLEQVAARRPDVVLAPSEPYPFGQRHVAELREIAPVELIDGQDLFWWGIRTPAAIERLAARLSHLRSS